MMRQIFILGAGRVASPCIEYLLNLSDEIMITVGSDEFMPEVERLFDGRYGSRLQKKALCLEESSSSLESLVKGFQVAISLLPYQFHEMVAKACISEKVNMVTASYISPGLASLDEAAKAAGIAVFNEVGLDPGIDHFISVDIIDEVHSKGGKILKFYSWCGGLPSPQDTNNPFGYKISWSPLGFLKALCNEAKFVKDGEIKVEKEVLKIAQPVFVNPALNIEGYPNRDSTIYGELYNINDADVILRGTLRYTGFSTVFAELKDCGFLSLEKIPVSLTNFDQVFKSLCPKLSEKAMETVEFLGLCDAENCIKHPTTYIEAMAGLVEEKCKYAPGEVDCCIMQNSFDVEWPDGKLEEISAGFMEIGDLKDTAMAKWVGIPAAIATKYLLFDECKQKGVFGPHDPVIARMFLKDLQKENIKIRRNTKKI